MATQLGKGFNLFVKTNEKKMMMSGGCRLHLGSSTTSLCMRSRRRNVVMASLISNLDQESTTTSTSSSSSIYVDSIYGTGKEDQKQMNVINDVSFSSSLEEEGDHQETLDQWMEYSVSEIVKNIEEAPLLMHVYGAKTAAIGSGSSSTIRIEKEKAVAESWGKITRRWEQGSSIPDGIILVEQLHHYDDDEKELLPRTNSTSSNMSSRTTTAWGVLVQGRGDSVCACYILKTCRVRSSLGFCTHFCLARAKCFGEIAELQLKNSWLHHNTWQ